MKKLFILLIVILITLVGCEGKVNETSENSNSEDSKITMNSDLVNLNYNYIRKPPIANWDFLDRKLNSLNDADSFAGYLDLRMADLRNLDLTNEFDRLMKANFDTNTKWTDKLPEGFDPQKIIEVGRNPGLGIRSLQEQGINGKGVNIAIIDQPLLLEHVEYGNQIRSYDEINSFSDNESYRAASMHGPFVTSISVGKTCGVAPEASVYYIGAYSFTLSGDDRIIDYTSYAEAINKILEINKSLPADQKIRAISISATWSPKDNGYKEITEAVERAKREDVFVISASMFESYGYWTYCMTKEPLTDPDNPESYKPYDWDSRMKLISNTASAPYYEKVFSDKFDSKFLLIPIGARSFASPTGSDVYAFLQTGGWSLMEPYIAGLYSLACQVNPRITPEEFWKAALETGESREITKGDIKYPAIMLNPIGLIESIKNNK